MPFMATKKRRFKKPDVCSMYIANVDTAEAANVAKHGIDAEWVKAIGMSAEKGEDIPQPSWKDIATLLKGQADLLQLANELYYLLEDPMVTHAVQLKKTIDEMRAQLDECRESVDRHEKNHNGRDPYY